MKLKHEHIPIPPNMRHLERTELGYLKPWFVKGDDFRVVDDDKAAECLAKKRCWICGKKFRSKQYAFVTGPKSAADNNAIEPPCHPRCAEYAVQVCPFIILPKAKRRESGLSEEDKAYHPMEDQENPEHYYVTVVKGFRVNNEFGMAVVRYTNGQIIRRDHWIAGEKVEF